MEGNGAAVTNKMKQKKRGLPEGNSKTPPPPRDQTLAATEPDTKSTSETTTKGKEEILEEPSRQDAS